MMEREGKEDILVLHRMGSFRKGNNLSIQAVSILVLNVHVHTEIAGISER